MKRYLKHIVLSLVTVLLTVSCLEEIEAPQPVFESEELTLVPRVKSFTNQYVTKAEGDEAAYTQAETKITHLAYLIFDSNGALVHKAEDDVQNGVGLTLNKTNLNSSETAATVVMFANVNLADIKKANSDGTFTAIGNTLTLEEFDDYSIHPTSDPVVLSADLSASGFKGFPMKGIAQNVNLTKSSKDPIVVSLQILYAKINFDISVAAGTENQNYEGITPSFTLSGYSVTNVPTSTPVKTLNDDETVGDIESTPSGTIYEYKGTKDDPSKTVSLNGTSASTFTFYMAESRYNHGGTDGVYPANLPDENRQQYKPQLATTGTGSPATGLATYVKINGTYIDYRGTSWTVNYKVYLGKNSYDNFHVDRNSEYKNYLTIKGIRNNDSYTDAGSVWIDHRVDVSTDDPSKHITITRETLIDSHIEVRPLRVKWDGERYAGAAIYLPQYPIDNQGNVIHNTSTTPNNWSQIDEVTGGANENWIAIENKNESSKKGRQYLANGKRKYFTTSLIEELNVESSNIIIDGSGHKYISMDNGDCAWIYFDENASSNTRRAKINVVFYTYDNTSVTETYDVYQSGYTPIGDLKVENYEEYLHSYDSEDNYNLQTSFIDYTQQGLNWGFQSNRVSVNMHASPIKLDPIDLLVRKPDPKDYISDEVRYDYFHEDDGDNYYIYSHDGSSWHDAECGTGLDFTIRAANAHNLTVTDMGAVPQSAYEYCLSKNKFHEDADGNHSMIVRWYLPDVYELNSLFLDSYTSADMAKDAYYWSSQPSSTDYGLASIGGEIGEALKAYSIKNEVTDKARAVSKSGAIDITRETVNRIRCFYNTNGESMDMSERLPSGLGGIIRIPMTVRNNGFFNYSDWITLLGEEPTDDYDNPSYRYPMGDTYSNNSDRTKADNYFGGVVFDGVHYYKKNPLSDSNWGKISAGSYTTYEAMHPDNWPGLTQYETDEVALDRYRVLTGTPKTDKKTAIVRVGGKITSMPDVSTVALDHNEGSNILTISFNKGTNSSHSPTYEYYNETSASIEEWTKYWQVPSYVHTPAVQQPIITCPPSVPSYDENDIKNDIEDEYLDGLTTKRKKINDGTLKFNYAETSYLYENSNTARSAAQTYFNNFINESGRYEIVSIETPSSNVQICTYDYTGQSLNWRLQWKDNGESGKNVSYNKTRYSWKITYQSINLYHYVPGTGGWDSGTKTQDGPTDPARSNVDALTMYGGNSFTISAVNGCKIKSIRVNYSDNNNIPYPEVLGVQLPSDNRYLRILDGSTSLPLEKNDTPPNMSYSGNGNEGWFQWTSPDETGSQEVTLKLGTYTTEGSINLGIISRPSSFTYIAPESNQYYQSDFETSIVIDSFEIRIEEVDEPTTIE